ncbi:MAG: GNAT family N-acetyltransferase, partial [Pseudobdellovibrionaceae bacterium]
KYDFKPLTEVYFEILFKWLQTPHVLKWWDSDDGWEQFSHRHVQMIKDPLVFPHIVFKDDTPIGYINYWFVEEDPDFKPLFPANTVGTDQFIGVPSLLGKGIGSEFVRQFTDELLSKSDIGLVITDPDSRNSAAIRAYEKAGFKKTRLMNTSEGEIQLLEKCLTDHSQIK